MHNGYFPGGGDGYSGQGLGYNDAEGWYDDPALMNAGVDAWRKRRRRRRLKWALAIVLVLVAGYFGYVKVYLPRSHGAQPAAAVVVPTPVLGTSSPGSISPSATVAAPAASSPATKPSAAPPPTLAWKPWLASRGGKDRVNLELGDTVLVDARQKAQAALKSGKNVRSAGATLAQKAAAELSAAQAARSAPLPPKVAQAAWTRGIAEVTKGATQLQAAGQAMQAGNKAAASKAIAVSNPLMTAAFNDLTEVDLSIPAP